MIRKRYTSEVMITVKQESVIVIFATDTEYESFDKKSLFVFSKMYKFILVSCLKDKFGMTFLMGFPYSQKNRVGH